MRPSPDLFEENRLLLGASMRIVDVSRVSFAYTTEAVVADVSLAVESGQIISLVGPSGCGKSTFLRLVAGLEVPSSGQITTRGLIAGVNRDALRFLFQDYDAYPWYTVWENVKLGSGAKPFPSDQAVKEILSQVGLAAEGMRYPGELSGGMRKRLALARCLVRRPPLLLLDEPFSSLDENSKYEMYRLVQRLWADTGCAVILVTHDLQEAILLADRILVSSARPMQIRGAVEASFARPRDEAIGDTSEYLATLRRLRGLLRPEDSTD
jgi:ABC-type nitrate/sulfonate/bicarbonate transport system ATPase subunit